DADNQVVVEKLTRMSRDYPDREHGFSFFVAPLSIGPRLVAYTLMPTARGDTMVYGVQYNGEGVRSILRDVYDNSELLPNALIEGRRNRDVVDIAITDERGFNIFAPNSVSPEMLEAETPLGLRFADFRVR